MNLIQIKNLRNSELANILVNAHLDSPINGDFLINKVSNITISGWAITRVPASSICIVITSNSKDPITIPLSINRPDVLIKVLGGCSSEKLICGFSGVISVEASFSIQLQVNGKNYSWIDITIEGIDPTLIDDVKNLWESFASSQGFLNHKFLPLTKIQPSLIDQVMGPMLHCHNISELMSNNLITSSGAHLFEDFFNTLSSPKLPSYLVDTALRKNQAELVNPFSGRTAFCSTSLLSDFKVNILLFRDLDEFFFIFQHVSSADAIYFPRRKLVIIRHHLTLTIVYNCISQLMENMEQVFSYDNVVHDFGGIIASHFAPYHFYYDIAPAIQSLQDARLLEKLPTLFIIKGEDFFSIKKLYDHKVNEVVITSNELRLEILRTCQFLIHTGIIGSEGNTPMIEKFDDKVRSRLATLIEPDLRIEIDQSRKCFPLLWFGVNSVKRTWVEQVDAGIDLINAIYQDFPGMGVCFDGWTAPLSPMPLDRFESANDLILVEDILKGIPNSVKTFNLIGRSSIDKMAFAQAIDFFVANYATGSMNVARFSKKPGVGHINNSMNCSGHIHYFTQPVPRESVIDISSGEKLREDFINYSISSKIIINMVAKIMRDFPLIQLRIKNILK